MRKIVEIKDGAVGNPDKGFRRPLDFVIYEGEQIAVLGKNGAGKSRFAEVLGYSLQLSGDAITYDFGDPDGRMVSDNVRYISFKDSYGTADNGYFLQQRWESSMIDEEAVPTVAKALGSVPDVDSLARVFGLDALKDRYVISLSSGELRKLRIAKALMKSPRMLVIDNPFIGLDVVAREDFSALLGYLAGRGMTIVLVLADFASVPDFITHVVEVDNLALGEKMPVGEYRQSAPAGPDPSLIGAVRGLPVSKLSGIYPKENSPEIVRCRNVSIRYGDAVILQPLDWVVREGERWLLTGRNGSGKSTLLSLVCADNPQSYACDIELFSHPRGTGESVWDIKRHIGYVSPELQRAYRKDVPAIRIVASGMFETMGLFHRPDSSHIDRAAFWMKVFGVEGLADRSFLSLSDGEQRLCLLARAFVKDPELLVLDEPFHGLDPERRLAVMETIDAFMSRPHKTLLFVSHYMSEVPSCINRRLELARK